MSVRTGIRIAGFPVETSETSTALTVTTESTRDLVLNTNEGTNSGSITIKDGTSGDIEVAPKGDLVIDDGDIELAPTTISTAHIKVPAGSLDIRCANNLKMGTDGADSVRIGRTNTTTAKVYLRSGNDDDLVVSNGKIGIGTETPAHTLDVVGDVDISGGLSFDAGTAVTSIDTDLSSVSGSDDTLASAKAIKAAIDAVPTGDITGVTAGTGLSGGGTSGAVTLNVEASQTQITAVGTIATGTWEGTDVGVAHGGTGVSTLTDGGVLLGSGTGAVTAMAVLTDGQMIVGDGTGDPVAESGATLRTSIGVGTGDSPEFTDLELTGGDLTFGDGQNATVTIEAVSGTNTAGKSITVKAGQGTGSGAGGDIVFQTANAGGSGSSANALATALTISDDKKATFEDDVAVAGELELGHASDTTLSRSSAGVLAVEGTVVPTVSSTSTLTNKTLTSPVLTTPKFADDGYIADANGNEQLEFTQTGSAVNHWKMTNGANSGGNGVVALAATGDSTNVAAHISPQGNGYVAFTMPHVDSTVKILGFESGDAVLELQADEADDSADQWAVSATTDGHFLIESKASGSLVDQLDILGGGSAAPGGGFDRTNGVVSYVSKLGAEIVTTLHVDLHAAVAESTATAEAVIGEDGVADVYLTQLSAATNGVIYKVEMSCIETPTTGEPDIDLVGNSHELDHGVTYDSTGAETVIIAAGGDWAAGMSMQTGSRAALAALASDYLYLAGGASGTNDDGVYDAGQFIIKLYGAAARS